MINFKILSKYHKASVDLASSSQPHRRSSPPHSLPAASHPLSPSFLKHNKLLTSSVHAAPAQHHLGHSHLKSQSQCHFLKKAISPWHHHLQNKPSITYSHSPYTCSLWPFSHLGFHGYHATPSVSHVKKSTVEEHELFCFLTVLFPPPAWCLTEKTLKYLALK